MMLRDVVGLSTQSLRRYPLRASMLLALRKRPVSVEQVEAALERIQDKLLTSGAKEVPSTRLGELVMRELKRIDKVAYVRFASGYREFREARDFEEFIGKLGGDSA